MHKAEMKTINNTFRTTFAILSLALCCIPSAFGFEAESGMWGIAEELNGKPGRGLQLDQQGGNTLIVTYFGYRTDGSSLFLQSSGPMNGKRYEGTFSEYRNGTVLAGPRTTGELDRMVGDVSIEFTSSITGIVRLPGEGPKQITRLQYENPEARFNASYEGGVTQSGAAVVRAKYVFNLADGKFKMHQIRILGFDPDTSEIPCTYEGTYTYHGKGIKSEGTMICEIYSRIQEYKYKSGLLTVSEEGIFTGSFYPMTTGSSKEPTTAEYHWGRCTTNQDQNGYTPACHAKTYEETQ